MEEAELIQENPIEQSVCQSSEVNSQRKGDPINTAGKQVSKPVQLLLLGEASSLLGVRELRISWSDDCDTIGDLLTQLSEQYSVSLTDLMRPDFRFAHNAQLIQGGVEVVCAVRLSPGDEVAILPPVTGG